MKLIFAKVSAQLFQPTYKPKIEILGDDSDSDSDVEDAEDERLLLKTSKTSSQNSRPLIQEIDDTGDESESTVSMSRSVIEEVSMENIQPVISDTPRSDQEVQASSELLDAIGKVLGKGSASHRGKIDFTEEEKKFAAMTKEEKIQDLAENLGSTVGRKSNNMDIWQPEDELD